MKYFNGYNHTSVIGPQSSMVRVRLMYGQFSDVGFENIIGSTVGHCTQTRKIKVTYKNWIINESLQIVSKPRLK